MIFIDQPAQVGFSYSVPVPGMYTRSDPFLVGAMNRTAYFGDQNAGPVSYLCLVDWSCYNAWFDKPNVA